MLKNDFKDKLDAGETVVGTFVKFNCPTVIEMLGRADFDFFIIDREHAAFSDSDVERMVIASDSVGLPVIVRTPSDSASDILHALDSGAAGVQIPNIESVEQVKSVVKNAKYYPEGSRGLSFAQRAAGYGFDSGDEYIRQSNRNTTISIHIENVGMVNRLDEICSIPAVDVLFIGPGDLSQSLGKPGQSDDPEVVKLVENCFDIGIKNGKRIGIYVNNKNSLQRYSDLGATYFAYKSDTLLFADSVKNARMEIGN
ncbi:MAG: hypothetical protein LBO70_05360 [Clostridiales Family XIII bacterium]|nr:hypothetical protein [Clostridiales Family XIII bacterium]